MLYKQVNNTSTGITQRCDIPAIKMGLYIPVAVTVRPRLKFTRVFKELLTNLIRIQLSRGSKTSTAAALVLGYGGAER